MTAVDHARRAKIVIPAEQLHTLLGLHPDLVINGVVSSPDPATVHIFVVSNDLPRHRPGTESPIIRLSDEFNGSTVGGNHV